MEEGAQPLPPSGLLSSPSHTTQDHQPRAVTAHSGLVPSASTGNKGDVPQTWPQASLMEAILGQVLLFLNCLHVCLKFAAEVNCISLYKFYRYFYPYIFLSIIILN